MTFSIPGLFSGAFYGQVEIIRLISQMNFWISLILFSEENKTK